MDLRCFTVNLCTKTDGSMTCNLLDSDHVRSKDNLIDKRGCIHYGSKVRKRDNIIFHFLL